MKTLALLVMAPICAALVGCAGQTYRVDVGATFAKTKGDLALQNAPGTLVLANNENDVDGNLGVGDTEVSPYLRLQTDYEKHRVRLHGFNINADGSGTLAGAYGDLAGGSVVSTSLDLWAITAAWAYEVSRTEDYRLAVGAQLGYYSLDVAARSTVGREAVTTDLVVPMPYGEAEVFLGDFSLGADLAFMSADIRDANGIYLDLEAYGRWQANEQFDVMLGYRYLKLDAFGRATDRDFDSDLMVDGFFIAAGIKF